jgi:Domain of unknown function (DUF4340)
MQLRNTIIALVLLALIGGYVYFFQAGKSAEGTTKLLKVNAGDITRVVLKYPDKEIEVKLEGGKWKLVKPIQADADAAAISTLTRELANCEVKRTVDEHPKAEDLTTFGLAKPQVTITASTKDKTLPGVEVGRTTPIGYMVYIKTTDKPAVMLTAGGFGPGTKRTVSDLRDHTLMTFKVDDVNRLTLSRPGTEPVELQKQQGKWEIVKPAKYQADAERVRQLLSSMAGARIDDFTSDNPSNVAEYGLDKPEVTVSVFTGPGNSRESLEFGKKEAGKGKDAYYVRRGEAPNVYTVHSYVFTDVDKQLNDLRDRTVLAFEPNNVEQVKFSGGKSFALARQGKDRWTETDGAKSEGDPVKVKQFLDRIHDLKGESIVADSPADLGKFGLASPNQEVTLLGKDGKAIGWVKLAKVDRHNETTKNAPVARTDYYAMSSAMPTVYKLFDYDYTDVVKTPDQFALPKPKPSPTAKK